MAIRNILVAAALVSSFAVPARAQLYTIYSVPNGVMISHPNAGQPAVFVPNVQLQPQPQQSFNPAQQNWQQNIPGQNWQQFTPGYHR